MADFFLWTLCIYHPILSWPIEFLLRNLLITLSRFTYIWRLLKLAAFKILFVVFKEFDYNISQWIALQAESVRGFLSFLYLDGHLFTHKLEVFNYYFLKRIFLKVVFRFAHSFFCLFKSGFEALSLAFFISSVVSFSSKIFV